MFNTLPWYIGLRYIRAKRRNGFIAFVSLFAFFGMALGVFALIVVLSVMNGFDLELKKRILRVIPHGFITTAEPLKDWQGLSSQIQYQPNLLASAPFIEGRALLSYGGGVRGIQLEGILPEEEAKVSEVSRYMMVGHMDYLQPGEYGIVLGSLIARSLGLTTGDRVTITLPVVSVSPAGIFPRSKRFRVVGVFEVGAQVDQSLALIHIADAQKLFRIPGEVHGLRLKFDNIYTAPASIQQMGKSLGDGFKAKDWSQTQGSLFQAVKMEKTVVGLLLSIIVAVAAFNIVTSLIMMVAEKRSDIAVLRTLGLTRASVVQIFMVQGSVMGVAGVVFGTVFGILGANYLSPLMTWVESQFGFQVFDADVYFVTHLPSVWRPEDTVLVSIFATVLSILATIYPAYRASLIAPAEALRYDT
ncbi:Lipoprotein-releasing system transmembrane protein LolE [Thalassocella blandensis]|nr:Lipoprotein-releasing system transmembrane protein LolE [Thalassocella blandensis]